MFWQSLVVYFWIICSVKHTLSCFDRAGYESNQSVFYSADFDWDGVRRFRTDSKYKRELEMSKIQITELNNSHTSRLDVLNEAETAKVLGGGSYSYRFPSFDFSAYISAKFDIDIKELEYIGKNKSYVVSSGGNKYNFVVQYKHGGNAHNYSVVKQ